MKKALLKILVLFTVLLSLGVFAFTACGAVEFNVNFVVDGEIYSTISTSGKETIKIPENPVKENYTFDGWFWDNNEWQKPFAANSLLDAPLSSDMSVYAKFTEKHRHNYVAEIFAPTCTEQGYTVYTCKCGDAYVDNYVNKRGHEFTNYVSDNNATYDSDGTKTAHCNHGCGATDVKTDVGSKLQGEIVFKTLTVNGKSVYGKIPNAQNTFDFLEEIEVKGDVTYKVSKNISGSDLIESKTAEPTIGDNTYYILLYFNNQLKSRYTVTIRRRPIYTVSFNTNGGSYVYNQYIEEDSFANCPIETTRVGYTFVKWSYNFDNAITDNTTISAEWKANEDTPYQVRYYLQNLENGYYTLDHADNLTGTTETAAVAEIKTFEHFTPTLSSVTGNINSDGSTVLNVYYTRDKYEYSVANENESAGAITCTKGGTYKYGTPIELSATLNEGYDFLGWYNGETLISDKLTYSFELSETSNLTAKYYIHINTPYQVKYYLENLENNDYTLDHTDYLTGTTDTTATAEIKSFEHFTPTADSVTGNINGDGSTVLNVYYNIDVFNVTFNLNGGTLTSGSLTQKIKYQCNAVAPVFYRKGATFIKFDQDFTNISSDLTVNAVWDLITYTITYVLDIGTMPENVATYTVDDDIVLNKPKGASFYDFSWYTGSGIKVSSITHDTLYGNLTLTGKWLDGNKAFTIKNNSITGVTNYGKTLSVIDLNDCVFDTITSISSIAFSDCTNVREIIIPEKITSIGAGAFIGCSSLESITIPFVGGSKKTASDTYQYPFGYIFGNSSYTGSTATTQYYYGSSTSYTSYTTYYMPTSLKTVTVTGGNILYGAFYNCSGLTSVTIGDGVTSIGEGAFANCSDLTSITVSEKNANYKSIDGNLYNKDGDTLIQYAIGKTNTEFTIPSGVTSIGSNAFVWSGLTSVTIPDSVTSIGDYAFFGCGSLTSVTIPDSVTSIGYEAFLGCSGLTSVTIPNSVTSIGHYAFENCGNLMIAAIGNGTIGHGTFNNCSSLTSLIIGKGVKGIGSYAFHSCNSLSKVYYCGTFYEWDNISIDNYDGTNNMLINATRYYYSETDPAESGNYWHYVDGVPTEW